MSTNKQTTMLSRLNKFKYIIIIPIIGLIIWLLSSFIYKTYTDNKANKNSLLFNTIQENLMQGKEDSALVLLKELQKQGTSGYQLISYLQEASLSINKKEYIKATEALNKVHNLGVPQYYKDLANYIIFSIKLDHDKDLKSLISSIENLSKPNNAFYTSNLEVLAIAQYIEKDYNSALLNLDKIINGSSVPSGLRERAKSLKSLVLAYVK